MNTTSLNMNKESEGFDVICFSHLRWDFVFQRPQHLMTRFAQQGRVFVIEEPVAHDGDPYIEVTERGHNISVCLPHIPVDREDLMPDLVKELIHGQGLKD